MSDIFCEKLIKILRGSGNLSLKTVLFETECQESIFLSQSVLQCLFNADRSKIVGAVSLQSALYSVYRLIFAAHVGTSDGT